jgi:cytoskeletal protein RodZ
MIVTNKQQKRGMNLKKFTFLLLLIVALTFSLFGCRAITKHRASISTDDSSTVSVASSSQPAAAVSIQSESSSQTTTTPKPTSSVSSNSSQPIASSKTSANSATAKKVDNTQLTNAASEISKMLDGIQSDSRAITSDDGSVKTSTAVESVVSDLNSLINK